MSVAFANAVVAGLRHNGVPVRFIDGWERRGNGQVSNYQGLSWHHTASDYGRAYATLWNGRAGLSGPVCNSSGDDDGGITIIAAHPANHAGASGGRNMGPLPTTNLFNKLMWGHEIVYPGTAPMRDAQYRSALILAGVISGILRRPNADWARGHAETSITGKWDPGYANGKTYDLNRMRAEVWGALNSGADDMFEQTDRDKLNLILSNQGFVRDQILAKLDEIAAQLNLVDDNLTWSRDQGAGWVGADKDAPPGNGSVVLTKLDAILTALSTS